MRRPARGALPRRESGQNDAQMTTATAFFDHKARETQSIGAGKSGQATGGPTGFFFGGIGLVGVCRARKKAAGQL